MNVKRYYRAYNDLIKKYERLSYQVVLKGFKGIYKRASEQYLSKPDTPIELLVSEQDTLDILVKIYDGIGISMGLLVTNSLPKQKGKSLNIQTKADKKPKKQYIPTPDDHPDHTNYWKQEFIRFTQSTDCAAKVKGITDTTRNQIRQVMNDAVKDQLSHKQIAKLLLDEADGITTKKRALLIARTENAVGSNLGAMYAARSSGLVLYKQWIARSGDSRTRDSHAGMVDSAPIPIDDLFSVGGEKMSQPGDSSNGAKAHNICNCRCTVAFIPASEVIPVGLNPSPTKKPRKPRTPKPKPTVQPELFDNIIQPAKSGFTPAKNLLEAENFILDNKISKNVDYSFIKDVKVVNEINEAIFNLKQRFPFNTLENVGKNTANKNAMMSANYNTLNINHSKFTKLEKSKEIHRKAVDDYLTNVDLNIAKVTQWMSETTDPRFIKTYRKQLADLENRKKFKRFTVSYTEESIIKDSVYHEFGHVLHDQRTGLINSIRSINKQMLTPDGKINDMAIALNSEMNQLYYTAINNGDIHKISYYASTDKAEFFCESFVMFMNKDASLPRYISEFLERYLTLTK